MKGNRLDSALVVAILCLAVGALCLATLVSSCFKESAEAARHRKEREQVSSCEIREWSTPWCQDLRKEIDARERRERLTPLCEKLGARLGGDDFCVRTSTDGWPEYSLNASGVWDDCLDVVVEIGTYDCDDQKGCMYLAPVWCPEILERYRDSDGTVREMIPR